jgi:anti-sigma-K factor RskA
VSGCPTHGPLVGGYVLGALEPGEMEEMRRHVAGCPHCGPEAERLAALPGLLDRIVPADVPPPVASPEVEEAVLDRFARERREATASSRRSGRLGRLRVLRRRPLAVAGAALVALLLALAVLLPLGGGEGESAYADVRLDGPAGARDVSASAQLAEVPEGTRIHLWTRGLRSDTEYEVWCIRADGRWVSGGTFWADADGSTEAELTAAVKPGEYHRMAVTSRPSGADEATRGPTVLRGELRY